MPGRKVQAPEWRSAVEPILAPLVRVLRQQGLSSGDIVQLLSDIVVRVDDIGDRKGIGAVSPELSYAAGTRLISRWRNDSRFSDSGIPRPLPLTGARSFATLTDAAGIDAGRARAALQRLGMIRVSRGRLVLLVDAYVPARGAMEMLDIVGRDGAEFIRTMLHNVTAPASAAFLQRKTSYDNIGSDGIARLMQTLRRHGMDALISADAMLSKADRDRNPRARGGRRTRVSFGVYCFSEPVSSPATSRRRGPRRRSS